MTTRAEDAFKRVMTEPTISVDETALLLGVGRSTVYAAVKLGEVPSIRIRNRLRIPSSWLLQILGLVAQMEVGGG